jgi:DNA replication protein DnaC
MQPAISHEAVRRALTDLSRDRAPRSSPLVELCAVTREIRRQGMTDSAPARMFIVCRILTRLAEERLGELRSVAGVRPMGGSHTVAADFTADHPELEAWSAIYHVYMRPDLNISLRRLTQVLGDRHRRTVQRRLRRGVLALTRSLFEAEAAARAAEREELTLAAIPRVPREATAEVPVARAAAATLAEMPGSMLVISGAPGSGKTTLAALIAREASRSHGLPVTWLDEPDRAHLMELGLDGSATRSGRSRAAPCEYDSLVVLDGIDDLATVRQIEAGLRPRCRVVLTTICAPATLPPVRRLERPPMRHDEAIERLTEGLAALDGQYEELEREHLAVLADAIDGSMLALQVALHQLRVTSWSSVVSALRTPSGFGLALCERMWRRRWSQAPAGVRDLLLSGTDAGRVRTLDTRLASERAELTAIAVESGLLRCEGSVFARSYVLPSFLAQYLRIDRSRITTVARGYADMETHRSARTEPAAAGATSGARTTLSG